MTFALAMFAKPFVMLLLAATVLTPARLAVMRYMRDGKLKRLLLKEIGP